MRVLIFSVLGLIALSGLSLAELYQYADEKGGIHITDDPGSIPERERKRARTVKDGDPGSLPISGPSHKAPDGGGQGWADAGPRPGNPPVFHVTSPGPAERSSPASQPGQPNQQLVTINTDTQNKSSSVDEFFVRQLKSMLEKKFKDADPSKVAAMNADATIDCTPYKKNMDEDMTNVDALIKDVNKRRERGDSEVLIKLQFIWGLRHIVNMLYDAVVTPKHCQEEFERENKGRFAEFNNNIAGEKK